MTSLPYRITALGLVALTLAGCASSSQNIAASSTSPLAYQGLTCPQIGVEASRVSARLAEVSGQQDANATKDAVAMGVALVVFWPALFLVSGNGTNAAEVAKLKGEAQALEQASNQRRCGITFATKPPAAS